MTAPTSQRDFVMCPQLLRQVLNEVLSTPIDLPVALERQGRKSTAFRAVQTDGVVVIIKLTKGRNSYPTEAWVHEKYAHAQIPAPQVLYYSEHLPGIGSPCLVMTMIEGMPLFEAADSDSTLYGKVGALLGKMHMVELPTARFGLGAFLPSAAEWSFSWSTFITVQHAYPQSGEYLQRHGLWPHCSGDFSLLGTRISAHRVHCVLSHGDFGPDHILVDSAGISGVIDPGECFAGPAEYDLAHLALYISENQFQQVLNGYPGRPDMDMVHVYAALIALHKAERALRAGDTAKANNFTAKACRHYQSIIHPGARTLSAKVSSG